MSIVYLNGDYMEVSEAFLPITDRGFLFGDGAFTTLLVENGKVYTWTQHLKRLLQNCQILGIEAPKFSLEIASELQRRNDAGKGTWRLKILVTGGDAPGLDLRMRKVGTLLVQIQPYERPKGPLKLGICNGSPSTFTSPIKSLSYLDRLYIKDQAVQEGYDDCLCVLPTGQILETSCANIVWYRDGNWYTPSPKLPLLHGVTLGVLAKSTQQRVRHVRERLTALREDTQVYLCSSLLGILPVGSIEGRTFFVDRKGSAVKNFWEVYSKTMLPLATAETEALATVQ